MENNLENFACLSRLIEICLLTAVTNKFNHLLIRGRWECDGVLSCGSCSYVSSLSFTNNNTQRAALHTLHLLVEWLILYASLLHLLPFAYEEF